MTEFWDRLISFGNSLEWVLNLIGLIGLLTYPVTFYLWMRARGRYRKLIDLMKFKPAKGAVAVIIGVGVPSVKPDAEKYIDEKFDPPLPIVLSYDKQGYFDREPLLDIVRDIRDRVRELMGAGGIHEVHLFYGGPLAVAAALGAITDNWVPVRWYNHNKKTGQYEYMFTLEVETVKGI